MQQAARVSDMTAFMSIDRTRADERVGVLVEYDETKKIFTAPSSLSEKWVEHPQSEMNNDFERSSQPTGYVMSLP